MTIIDSDQRSTLTNLSAAVSAFRIGDLRLPMSLLPLFLVLAKQGDQISIGDLVRITGLSQPTVSRQIGELGDTNANGGKGFGLVRRDIVGAHTMVSLTPTGEALARRMANAVGARSDMAKAA